MSGGVTISLGIGRCGIGWQGGGMPELRLGLLRLSWCRGCITLRIAAWREALQAATRGIGA